MERGSCQRILIAGGTGLVGRALVQRLHTEGIETRILTRDPASAPPMEGVQFFSWKSLPSALDAVDAVVNL